MMFCPGYDSGNKVELFLFSFDNLNSSKLRLDHLMSTNYMIRDQYRAMASIGTPELTQAAKLQRIRDFRHGLSGSSPNPKLKEVRF